MLKIVPLNNCWAPDKDWMVEKLRLLYASLCTIPPCNETCKKLIVEYPLCVQWHTLGIKDDQNVYHYINWLQSCSYDGGYCQIEMKVCVDGASGVVVCPGTTPSYTPFNLTCQSTAIPEPGKPTVDFEGEKITSPCFQNGTCP